MRKDETQHEGSVVKEKVKVVNPVRVRMGGVGHDGDSGRDGEHRRDGDERRMVTLTNSTGGGGGGGLKVLSDDASVSASSNGPMIDLTGSASRPRMSRQTVDRFSMCKLAIARLRWVLSFILSENLHQEYLSESEPSCV